MVKICKNCGKQYEGYGLTFCSKSCAITYRNNEKVRNGTLNLLSKNGGSELAVRHNQEMVEQGIHPFLNQNKSNEFVEKQSQGISEARKREAEEGTHIWQRPEVRINNEWSKEYSVCERDGIKMMYLYLAECNIPGHFKFGVTRDIDYRTWDTRSWELTNIEELLYGSYDKIIDLERDLKHHFLNEERFKKFNSGEVLPIGLLDEFREFVKSKYKP